MFTSYNRAVNNLLRFKVTEKLKTIGLVVSIGINVFQFISDEAQEWYALTRLAKAEKSDYVDITKSKGTGIYRDMKITKAGLGR